MYIYIYINLTSKQSVWFPSKIKFRTQLLPLTCCLIVQVEKQSISSNTVTNFKKHLWKQIKYFFHREERRSLGKPFSIIS